MWYFSWMLGIGLAVSFGILNGMWYEFQLPDDDQAVRTSDHREAAPLVTLQTPPPLRREAGGHVIRRSR